jgi:two-component system phosphate regulon sensor histidine kinase PhoR
MKKRSIVIITVLMALALLGVMAMQFWFLRQSYQMQSKSFDHDVTEALNNVVNRITKQDAINFLNDKVKVQNQLAAKTADSLAKVQKKEAFGRVKNNTLKPIQLTDDGLIHVPAIKTNLAHNQKIAKLRDSMKRMIAQQKLNQEMEDIGGSLNIQTTVQEYTNEYGQVERYVKITPQINGGFSSDQFKVKLKKTKLNKYLDTVYYLYPDPQFGHQSVPVARINPLWVQDQALKKQEQQIKQIQKLLQVETADVRILPKAKKAQPAIFENLAREYQRTNQPLKERIDQRWVDTLLKMELSNQHIYLKYNYEVTKAHNDSVIFLRAANLDEQKPIFLPASTYQMPIFSKEVIDDPGKLWVYFPQKNSLILGQMAATMATSGGLLIVLIFCFGFTIYSILRQKKISEMKTDFINNMTHEFKTPVSTIMIASEALKDAEIAQDKNRVAKLAGIIYDENVRLGSHIERVLNIARIEKNDFKLDVKTVDVNEMITTVIDSMLLKLQKHEVKVDLDLCAGELLIKADELHFSNVIYNLIDNAIKYSNDTPEIVITTAAKNNQAIIKVADKGIGMSSDQQTKIFEQFYRIPTGNLHDVKGFGLGLSYVNTIVKRLNGTIGVKSEKDKGSEFEMKFDKVAQSR